jgi:folate-dependent phosphoribosylglycinamide formyltransferase PurN
LRATVDDEPKPFRSLRVLIAEAYARGHLIEEAALFLVDQRSQDEIYPQALESEHEMYLRALAERFRGTGEMLPV